MIIVECLIGNLDWPEIITIGATSILVIITGYYAWQTKKTVQLLKIQIDEMKKQNEIENKYKNIDMWDGALKEFFIPFKGMIAHCSNIASGNEQPSGNDLSKIIEEAKFLLRHWEYRVLDSKTTNTILEYLTNMKQYPKDVNNNADRRIFIDDCDTLIDLFLRDIKNIKSRLRYKDLD